MNDHSGNLSKQRSKIKDCNVQPDAAATELKLEHTQKKIPPKNIKRDWGILCFFKGTKN
jgi:hypothetical protein